MTKEKLQERLSFLTQKHEEVIGQVNMIRGAIEEVKHQMIELDKEIGT